MFNMTLFRMFYEFMHALNTNLLFSQARGEEPSSLLGHIAKDPGQYNLSLDESSWLAVAM